MDTPFDEIDGQAGAALPARADNFDAAPATDDPDAILIWMSLALDGLLDEADEERLYARLAVDASLRETWRAWQKVDLICHQTPHAQPEAGFGARFVERLAVAQGRARRRQQVFFAAAALVAWIGLVVLVGLLGWILLSNHSQWMNGFVRELVFYPSAVAVWMRAARSSLSVFVGEPQSLAVGAGYMAACAVVLYGWLIVLRRTTREEVVSS